MLFFSQDFFLCSYTANHSLSHICKFLELSNTSHFSKRIYSCNWFSQLPIHLTVETTKLIGVKVWLINENNRISSPSIWGGKISLTLKLDQSECSMFYHYHPAHCHVSTRNTALLLTSAVLRTRAGKNKPTQRKKG